MTNKLDKRTNCEYCDKPLDAKYRSKRFCDDKCRIYWNRENPKVKVTDLTTTTNVVEPQKPLGSKKTNLTINTAAEPKEGSGAFFLKYGVETWAEVNDKKDKK